MKYRWEVMGESDEEKDLADVAIEAVLSKKENEAINAEIDEEKTIEEAQTRSIFDPNKMTLNLSKRRATDLKGNARVIFPKKILKI